MTLWFHKYRQIHFTSRSALFFLYLSVCRIPFIDSVF